MNPVFSRRAALAGLAALPLLAGGRAGAQPQRRVITSSIRLQHNRVWVPVEVGGNGPLQFIIDTGAVVSLVQPQVARRLALKSVGNVRLVGVGGPQMFELFAARDVVFGGAIRQTEAVFAAPKDPLGLGPNAAGALAAGMLTSRDTDLDFESGEWRVYPDGRGDWTGFEMLESTIRAHSGGRSGSEYIYVTVELDGRPYRLLADTGMPGQLSLDAAAVRRSGLWDDSRPFVPHQSRGIGGAAARGRLVRAGRVKLGNIAFDRPLVSLSDPKSSSLDGIDGLIGLALLQQLTLSTDVRRGRLWGRRNNLPAPTERFGLSGLWIDQSKGRLTVAEVSPASPAAAAGLRLGDEILDLPFPQLIGRLSGKPGDTVQLRIRRREGIVAATITLAPYI